MSKRGSVQFTKQVPKFLQEFHTQHPELTAASSLHAAAAAHDSREMERNERRRNDGDLLPVVVNMEEFRHELLNNPRNADLLAQISGQTSETVITESTPPSIPLTSEAIQFSSVVPAKDATITALSPPNDVSDEAERLEAQGRHAFRRRSDVSTTITKPKKKISKNRQHNVNVLSFDE
uniref:DUF4604 domain-containing protein n=1 Tax=Spongospora subterranea TaxID=70186 RepID=A0A0H5QZ28_9EUKA|eukprot:CRZ00797.1 hypothetical protein [Spongospora subterranea]